jgi:replicative DNA helicase
MKKNKILSPEMGGYLPPRDVAAERVILGSILFESNQHQHVFNKLKPEHFYNESNQLIYAAMCFLYDQHIAIDIVTICDRLKSQNKLAEIGGAYYVSELTQTYSFIAIERHVFILLEMYMLREMYLICGNAARKTHDPTVDVFDLCASTESQISKLISGIIPTNTELVEPIKNRVINELITSIETGIKPGVLTGIDRLNQQTNGWQKSDLIILAGRPGMGKTSAALDFALTPALKGKPTAIFSLEMSREQIAARCISICSNISAQDIIYKRVDAAAVDYLINDSRILNGIPLFIDDTPALSLSEFKTRARILKSENKIELIIVDYLQLMTVSQKYGSNREQEISEISRGLKAMAKELQIPIIALSQLSRECEKRPDKKPILSDLRESGAIEQDADIVIFVFRPEYYDGYNEYQIGNETITTAGLMVFIIAKFRNGHPGEVRARFIAHTTAIKNYNY